MIHEVIVKELMGTALNDYVSSQTAKLIPEKDREAFLGDVWEDLKWINPHRIAGLGITVEQLENWLKKCQATI